MMSLIGLEADGMIASREVCSPDNEQTRPAGGGVGQSSATFLSQTGLTSIQGFFSASSHFWGVCQPIPSLRRIRNQLKSIAVSDT
jgi:hypothetical protein